MYGHHESSHTILQDESQYKKSTIRTGVDRVAMVTLSYSIVCFYAYNTVVLKYGFLHVSTTLQPFLSPFQGVVTTIDYIHAAVTRLKIEGIGVNN